MPDYRAQVTPRDRWNIVAYIRALQLAERAPADDVKRAREIEQQKPAPATAKPTGHQ
jgi:hypothetical protein